MLDFRVEKRIVSVQITQPEQELEALKNVVYTQLRTLIKHQSDIEQRVRFERNSGVSEVGSMGSGMHPYHQGDLVNEGVLNIRPTLNS